MNHVRRRLVFWVLAFFGFGGLLGCSGSMGTGGTNDLNKQGVCMVDKTSVRAQPGKKAKWLSSLGLGETVKVLGKAQADPEDPKSEYYEVELSDGNKGWVSSFCLVKGARAGALRNSAKIYKRPDLLSGTDKQFETMELVAVEEEKSGWSRVVGEGRAKSGWIENQQITSAQEDVVTAILLGREMRAQGKLPDKKSLGASLNALPYPGNYFAEKAREKFGISGEAATVEPVSMQPTPLEALSSDSPAEEQPRPEE